MSFWLDTDSILYSLLVIGPTCQKVSIAEWLADHGRRFMGSKPRRRIKSEEKVVAFLGAGGGGGQNLLNSLQR